MVAWRFLGGRRSGQDADGIQPAQHKHIQQQPALQPNQAIAWLLNGEPLDQPPDALAFQLDDLARGTYTLNATVTDTDTHETQSSAAVTFYVQKPSMLSPAHQK